jgi:DNA-binding response OmpR family regulator
VHFSWQLWAHGPEYSDMCASPLRQPARVLLLEDDATLSAVLVEFLACEGFDVAACDTYASLREALHAADRPIVVADFWGASHARLSPCERDQIREIGRCTPTVLFTGRAWAGSATADELNVACILAKPVGLEELVAQVLLCLERQTEGQ